MKNLILFIALIAINTFASAQGDSMYKKMYPSDSINNHDGLIKNRDMNNNPRRKMQDNPDSTITKQIKNESYADGVLMQHGQIMVVKDGNLTPLDHNMTMSNGTKIMYNGSYMKKGGTRIWLKEGQHINMSGKLTPSLNSSLKIKKTS